MAATARLETTRDGNPLVVLENSAIRVEFDPYAGGSVTRVRDKRSDSDLQLAERLRVAAQGVHPAPSLWAIEEEAGAWSMLAICGEVGLSATFTLHPTEAKVQVDATLHNRSLTEALETDLGLAWPDSDGMGPGACWRHDAETRSGIGVLAEDDFAFRTEGNGLWKHPVRWRLAPRQSVGFRCLWVALADLPRVDTVTSHLAMAVGDRLCLRVFAPVVQGRIDLLVEGQPMSAPFTAYPERTLAIDLPPGTERVAVVGDRRQLLAEWPSPPNPQTPRATPTSPPPWWLDTLQAFGHGRTDRTALKYGLSEVGLRGLAHALLGTEALRNDQPAEASRWFEGALGFASDDHLAWWALAFSRRLANLDEQDDDRWALVGAHEAAPLEPMLRVEAFLSQPSNHREPSPLLAPLAAIPGLLAVCAATLLETGQLEQTARFIDEALRHGEDPMLRCVMAATVLRSGRMAAQAAEHASHIGALSELKPQGMVQRAAVDAVAAALGS